MEFALKLSARLRREYLIPHIVVPGGYGMTEISLEALAKLGRRHDLFIPEELDCEYLGDLTEAIASGSITPVIENVLNSAPATWPSAASACVAYCIPGEARQSHFRQALEDLQSHRNAPLHRRL